MKKAAGGRFLAFDIDGGEYAVEVERVEVVLESMPITRVPKAPAHLKGVINYRGAVIPVADLRTRFRLSGEAPAEAAGRQEKAAEDGPDSGAAASGGTALVPVQEGGAAPVAAGAGISSGASIVVLHVRYSGDDIVMGVLADAVREVLDIDDAHIDSAPSLGGRDALVAGIGEKDGRFIVLLDIEEAFNAGEGFKASSVAAPESR